MAKQTTIYVPNAASGKLVSEKMEPNTNFYTQAKSSGLWFNTDKQCKGFIKQVKDLAKQIRKK